MLFRSLMISTMESYFRGERELFQGLAIDRLEPEEWIKYPVLRLDFTRGGYNNPDDLPKFLGKIVDAWEKEYGTSHPDQTPDWRFDKIIHDIYEQTGRQVVILIDEYDSPIVDSHGWKNRSRLGQCAGADWDTFDAAKLMIFSETVAF